jgi:anaerobic magnesium-protoporphyrin IX monomethyl ester cyclase
MMKIAFVSVENSLIAIGFRNMAALVRQTWPQLEALHVVPFKAASPLNRLRAKPYDPGDDPSIDGIASHLAKSDVVCFSCMSSHAPYTHLIIRALRTMNPGAFVVWGGIHAVIQPEDAILNADAVCVGEGEIAFPRLLGELEQGKDYTQTGNFHVRRNGNVKINPFLPLQTPEQLAARPYPLLGDREFIYKPGAGFVPLESQDYVRHEGLTYNVVWSIGCPNRCIYCGNSSFLCSHRDYARLRYPPVDYIVGQIRDARRRYPHICSVTFHDDMFMAIPLPVIEEFASKWRDQAGLPFAVHGLMSRYVESAKLKLLISAGLFRVRMGIQSGSARTLSFYRRPDSPASIEKAVGVIHQYAEHMMTPSYDLIVDNPWESTDDTTATLDLLHRMPRPYILNMFPLMVIPGTELAEVAGRESVKLPGIRQANPSNCYSNAVILLHCLIRPPRRVHEMLRRRLMRQGATSPVHRAIMHVLLSSLNV